MGKQGFAALPAPDYLFERCWVSRRSHLAMSHLSWLRASSPPHTGALLWGVQAGDGRQRGKDTGKLQGGEKRGGDRRRRRCGSSRAESEGLPGTSRSLCITC